MVGPEACPLGYVYPARRNDIWNEPTQTRSVGPPLFWTRWRRIPIEVIFVLSVAALGSDAAALGAFALFTALVTKPL